MGTKLINQMDVKVGDIVHSYGARFEIISRTDHKETDPVVLAYGGTETFCSAIGKWLDGEIIRGYFGPDMNWNFQGNKRVTLRIETDTEEDYEALAWMRQNREREQYIPIPHPGDYVE